MAHSFDIILDPKPVREARAKRLDCVITPIDRFTGRIITRGIEAEIKHQRVKARRSLSGHLFFEQLIEPAPITVEFDTKGSGYFPPDDPKVFPAPQDLTVDAERILFLDLRPERVIDGETAVIRGRVKDAADEGVAAAAVKATNADGDAFETRSDANGTYALRVRLPDLAMSPGPAQVPVRGDVDIFAEKGATTWPTLTVTVTDMATGPAVELKLP